MQMLSISGERSGIQPYEVLDEAKEDPRGARGGEAGGGRAQE
jgi:hypothetical protein